MDMQSSENKEFRTKPFTLHAALLGHSMEEAKREHLLSHPILA